MGAVQPGKRPVKSIDGSFKQMAALPGIEADEISPVPAGGGRPIKSIKCIKWQFRASDGSAWSRGG